MNPERVSLAAAHRPHPGGRLAVTALALLSLGCTYLRSGQAPLRHQTLAASGADCVIVLLPGLGDSPELFRTHSFADALEQGEGRCDLEVVDSHFGYYRDAVIVERLSARLESLAPRYPRVWLVGVSLGGYGAALVAQARPDLVDGVVLISPFLGVPKAVRPLVSRIEREGGLEAFDGPVQAPTQAKKHFVMVEPLWKWLAERARDEGPGPRVVLAFGAEDGFAWMHRVVGAALDPIDVIEQPGGHDWRTFRGLWSGVAAAAPWKG